MGSGGLPPEKILEVYSLDYWKKPMLIVFCNASYKQQKYIESIQ